MNRGTWGNGAIDPRGEDTWRLRYRVDGRRYSVTFKGTRARPERSCGGYCATAMSDCTFHLIA